MHAYTGLNVSPGVKYEQCETSENPGFCSSMVDSDLTVLSVKRKKEKRLNVKDV